jgi:hypothetical protein
MSTARKCSHNYVSLSPSARIELKLLVTAEIIQIDAKQMTTFIVHDKNESGEQCPTTVWAQDPSVWTASGRKFPESEEHCRHTSHGAQCNKENPGSLYFFFYLYALGPLACAHSELINCEIWILQITCRRTGVNYLMWGKNKILRGNEDSVEKTNKDFPLKWTHSREIDWTPQTVSKLLWYQNTPTLMLLYQKWNNIISPKPEVKEVFK